MVEWIPVLMSYTDMSLCKHGGMISCVMAGCLTPPCLCVSMMERIPVLMSYTAMSLCQHGGMDSCIDVLHRHVFVSAWWNGFLCCGRMSYTAMSLCQHGGMDSCVTAALKV